MSITKRMLLALGGTFAFATMARAQRQGSSAMQDVLDDQQAVHLDPNGKMERLTLNADGDAAMKKYGRPVDGHAIVYRKDGRYYAVHDQTAMSQLDSLITDRQAMGTINS